MAISQMQSIVGVLAGCSLFLHLCSAGNFIPDSEMWLIGTIFSYLHSICNLTARLSLLSVVVMIALEAYLPNTVATHTRINADLFPKYLSKLMLAALLCTAVRFVIPGPITYYSRFYKLSLLLSLGGSASAFLDANSRRSSVFIPVEKEKVDKNEGDKKAGKVPKQSVSSDDSYIPTKRHRTAMELLQTETSYLRNLNTIITVYKEPLEKAVGEGRPLLAPEDIRNIFGGIKDIADLHSLIHRDVSDLIDSWTEDCCVADIIKKYQEQLIKVYPPYVNYFDMGKEVLLKREAASVELQEFFLRCFHEPQSLKQTLDALLIRPVQRLPSLLLLISDMQKRTPEGLTDHTELEEAKEVLKQVLSHINEDKRKTEGKMKIFDIVYEVNGCPVEVISSNRLYIGRVDVTTLTDGLYRTGERLALYLLTDMLEVAKWRNRSHGNSLLKHIQLLPLNNIISVMDMEDQDDCNNIFAVKFVGSGSSIVENSANGFAEEKVCVLQLLDDKTFKANWINSLSQQIADAKGLSSRDEVLKKVKPWELMNYIKRGSKLYKKLRAKSKTE